MKQLYIDIETAPSLGFVWSLWKANISLSQLHAVGEVLCFAAKWHGEPGVAFYSMYEHGKEYMLAKAHALLSEADTVVHYNGSSFDIPWLNTEFIEAGMAPPAPFQEIDLLRTARRRFRWPSNKLEFVSQALGIGEKVKHSGFELWKRCMAGDPEAWAEMETYNKQDVALLEDLYLKFQPWITTHPNVPLIDGKSGEVCNNCASANLRREGYAYTKLGKFQRYQCRDCGTWGRSGKRLEGAVIRPVAA